MASPPCCRLDLRHAPRDQIERLVPGRRARTCPAPSRPGGRRGRARGPRRRRARRSGGPCAQMKLRVTGLSSPPSILWTRPFSTVTSSVHASGQSSGHAVRTVEWPQVPGVACPERASESKGAGHGRLYRRRRNARMRPVANGCYLISASIMTRRRIAHGGFDRTDDRGNAGGREDALRRSKPTNPRWARRSR